MKTQIWVRLVVIIVCVGAVTVTVWLSQKELQPTAPPIPPPVAKKLSADAPLVPPDRPVQGSEENAHRKIDALSLKMNDTEFSRMKVRLPQPVSRPWKAQFYDSQTCFDPKNKSIAVRVLPGWIRKAVIAGEQDLAGRFLTTFLKFTEDPDAEIAASAVISLYRMGDYDDFALKKMMAWMDERFDYKYSDSTAAGLDSKDIRAQILEELSLNNDTRLVQPIYERWLQNRSEEGKTLASVDYAYYLEKHGRELPADYWVERLDNPNGFANALEVAQSKGMPQVTAKLQTLFEELSSKPAANADSARAARVASALFRQTGDARYRDYLIERAQPQLASGSFENSLPSTLEGLAATNDKAALDVVSSAMQNENVVIREMAIDALGKTRDPAATELLFQAALQKTKQGTGFPAREMRALLAQNDPAADAKYEQLQQALLGGQLGWSATTSDFQTLEFFRKHGR